MRQLTNDEKILWARTTVDPDAHWLHLNNLMGIEVAEKCLIEQLAFANTSPDVKLADIEAAIVKKVKDEHEIRKSVFNEIHADTLSDLDPPSDIELNDLKNKKTPLRFAIAEQAASTVARAAVNAALNKRE